MAQRRARRRIRVSVAIADFARPDERRHVSTDMWPSKALCDAAQRRLIAVMRRYMQRTKHVFAKHGGNDDTCRDGALVAMLQERVFDNELTPRIDERLQSGVDLDVIRSGRAFAFSSWTTRKILVSARC